MSVSSPGPMIDGGVDVDVRTHDDGASVELERVIPCPTEQQGGARVHAEPAYDRIVAIGGVNRVVPVAWDNDVVPEAADDEVVAIAADHVVVARARIGGVVAVVAVDAVI